MNPTSHLLQTACLLWTLLFFSSCTKKEPVSERPTATYITGKIQGFYNDDPRGWLAPLPILRQFFHDKAYKPIAFATVNRADSTFQFTLHLDQPIDAQIGASTVFITPGDSVYLELTKRMEVHPKGKHSGNYRLDPLIQETRALRQRQIRDLTGPGAHPITIRLPEVTKLLEEGLMTEEAAKFVEESAKVVGWSKYPSHFHSNEEVIRTSERNFNGVLPLFDSRVIHPEYWQYLHAYFYTRDQNFDSFRSIKAYTDSLIGNFPKSYHQPIIMVFLSAQYDLRKREPRLKKPLAEFYNKHAEPIFTDSLVHAMGKRYYDSFVAHSDEFPDYVSSQQLRAPDGTMIRFEELIAQNVASKTGVYLQFWDTGSAPNVEEVQMSQLANWSGIPLTRLHISVAIDQDRPSAGAKANTLHQNHYQLPLREASEIPKNPFLHYFGAENGRNSYVMITPEGKLFSSSAPPPSDHEELKKRSLEM